MSANTTDAHTDRTEVRRIGLFAAAGAVAAAANFGSRFAFSHWFPYPLAILFAYLVGVVVAFTLMRNFVFEAAGKSLCSQVATFVLINLLAVVQTLAVSVFLARWLLPAWGFAIHVEAIAHAVGLAVPMATSYLGHKRVTFR